MGRQIGWGRKKMKEEVILSRVNFCTSCNLEKENEELKKDKEWLDNTNNEQTKVILGLQEQIEKYKTEKEYYDNLCHKKTVECDDLRKGINQFQSDNEKFIKKIAELHDKLEKVSEWVKEQEHPDGCIDCSYSDTEKLKEILK